MLLPIVSAIPLAIVGIIATFFPRAIQSFAQDRYEKPTSLSLISTSRDQGLLEEWVNSPSYLTQMRIVGIVALAIVAILLFVVLSGS